MGTGGGHGTQLALACHAVLPMLAHGERKGWST